MSKIKSAHIFLHLTDACPNRCTHCYIGSGEKKANELSFEEIYTLAKTWDEYYEKVLLILTGGEPTLREDFEDIIEMFKFGDNDKFKIAVFSQSRKLIDHKEILKKYKIRNAITISGMGDTQNHIMGRSNAWEDTVALIKEFHSSIRLFVHKDNLSEAAEIAKFLRQHKYKRAEAARPVTIGRGKGLILPTDEEFLGFVKVMRSNGIKIGKHKSTIQKELNKKLKWWMALLVRLFLKKMTKEYAIDKREILKRKDIGFCYLEYGNQFVDLADISCTGDVFSHCCFGINNPIFHAGNIRQDSWEKIRAFKPKCNYEMILKEFGNKQLCGPMDNCTLCVQRWDKAGFIK